MPDSHPSEPTDTAATRSDAPISKPKADPIAALVSLVVFILSAFKIPTALHLSTAATTAIGSAVVFTAASVRGYLKYRKGEEVALQDLFATAVGAIFLALSLAGVPNAIAIDADTAAMIGSALVTALSVRRTVKPAA